MGKIKLGLIPGVASEALSEDWDGTLARLRAIGFAGVEMGAGTLAKSGLDAAACRASLASHGLEAMSYFAGWGPFDTEAEQHIEAALGLGCRYMVWGWSPGEDSEQMRECLPVMHKAAGMVREAGMQLLYHNHDHEFRNRVGQEVGFDWLMAKFHPELLACELDVGWVAYGGRNVVETIRNYPRRCPILHLRDIGNPDERGAFTEIGTGSLDIPAIVTAGAATGGTEWAVVEHSKVMAHEAFAGLRIAAEHLQAAIDQLDRDMS